MVEVHKKSGISPLDLVCVITQAKVKVIHRKCYKNSNDSCTFCFVFGQIGDVRAVLKISEILLRYPFSSYFHGQNKYKIRIPVHCSVCPKNVD
jgi:hypothetical protein